MRISKNKGKLPYAYSLSESLKYKEPKNSTKQMVIFYVHTAAGKKKSQTEQQMKQLSYKVFEEYRIQRADTVMLPRVQLW